jgi:hypothetical protein
VSSNPWEGMFIKKEYRGGNGLYVVYYNNVEIGAETTITACKRKFLTHTNRHIVGRRY